MTIAINGLEYQCWHEVGHATACLHFGGNVELIELIGDDSPVGLARARCSTTPDLRQSVACGGFAAEFYLLRNGYLPKVDEREIAQIIFRNATLDRDMFHGRTVGDKEEFTKQEDEAFMNHAVEEVVPILQFYSARMRRIVGELIETRKLDGARVRELLLSAEP